MKIGAIITGDIVDSTKMSAEERKSMLLMLQSLPELLSTFTKNRFRVYQWKIQSGVTPCARLD